MNEEFLNKWKSQVKKGALSFLVLNLLKQKEKYGYEIIEEISRIATIDIAEGTLYPLLNRLKTEGLVDSSWIEQPSGIPRKYYVLTKTGKSTLLAMGEFWERLSESIKKCGYEEN